MKTQMHNLELGKKIAGDDNARARCELTVFLLLSFAEQVRVQGLHALAGPARHPKVPPFLRRGMEFLAGLDEIEPESAEKELRQRLDPGDSAGGDLLEKVLCLNGLIYILRGASHGILFEKLAAYFGEAYYDALRSGIRARSEKVRRERESAFQPDEFLRDLRAAEVLIPETGHLEPIVPRLSDADVDYILVQATDLTALNGALSGASGAIQIRFLERMAPKRLLEFKREREIAGAQPPYVLEEDQLALVNRIREFARAGELSIAESDVQWPA